MAAVGLVMYCVEVDPATTECTQTAWLPAPSLVPPLTQAQTAGLMAQIMVVLVTAYCFRRLDKATSGRR